MDVGSPTIVSVSATPNAGESMRVSGALKRKQQGVNLIPQRYVILANAIQEGSSVFGRPLQNSFENLFNFFPAFGGH